MTKQAVVHVVIRRTSDGTQITRVRKAITQQKTEADIKRLDLAARRKAANLHARRVTARLVADKVASHPAYRTDPFAWSRAYTHAMNGIIGLSDTDNSHAISV